MNPKLKLIVQLILAIIFILSIGVIILIAYLKIWNAIDSDPASRIVLTALLTAIILGISIKLGALD